MAEIESAFPASVPPIPPASSKSTFLLPKTLSAIYWVSPYAPQGIPPPILFPIVIISGFKFIDFVAPPYPALKVWV